MYLNKFVYLSFSLYISIYIYIYTCRFLHVSAFVYVYGVPLSTAAVLHCEQQACPWRLAIHWRLLFLGRGPHCDPRILRKEARPGYETLRWEKTLPVLLEDVKMDLQRSPAQEMLSVQITGTWYLHLLITWLPHLLLWVSEVKHSLTVCDYIHR